MTYFVQFNSVEFFKLIFSWRSVFFGNSIETEFIHPGAIRYSMSLFHFSLLEHSHCIFFFLVISKKQLKILLLLIILLCYSLDSVVKNLIQI